MLHIRELFGGKFALSNVWKPNKDRARGIDVVLLHNQRQHHTLHIQMYVQPYALCFLLSPISAALASIVWMEVRAMEERNWDTPRILPP